MDEPRTDGARTTLQTVERALSFLEFVADAHPPPTVREVAHGLGLNITTTYHLFNTLHARGYISRDESGGLGLGAATAALYRAMVDETAHGTDLQQIAERVTEETGETSYLSVRIGHRVVIKALAEASQTLRVGGLTLGYSGMEHVRASGKAVLAHLDHQALQQCLEEIDGLDAGVRAELLAELEAIRTGGVALDNEDYEPGVCCVAAPYFRADGQVAGSIAVSAPAMRFPEERGQLMTVVLRAAAELSEALGLDRHRLPDLAVPAE